MHSQVVESLELLDAPGQYTVSFENDRFGVGAQVWVDLTVFPLDRREVEDAGVESVVRHGPGS